VAIKKLTICFFAVGWRIGMAFSRLIGSKNVSPLHVTGEKNVVNLQALLHQKAMLIAS